MGFCAVAALGLLGLRSGKMATLSTIAAIGGTFLGGAGFCMLAMGIADLKSAHRDEPEEEQETWVHSVRQDPTPFDHQIVTLGQKDLIT